MLSYRHAFHAGNHADVLKHFVQVALLRYLGQKDKPYWYIDTHAGAGAYELERGFAQQNAEFEDGIGRLWSRQDVPEPLTPYLDVVRAINPDGVLRYYPGSPWFARAVAREQDRMRFFELHPADVQLLEENFNDAGATTLVQCADGFAGLKAFLPPPPRRALVLIDPPYEVKDDYRTVITVLKDALRRFATGTYAVWYPILQRIESRQLPEQLKQLPVERWLNVSLSIQAPSHEGFGMHGSGLFIINPPWTLHPMLEATLPWLTHCLAKDDHARFTLEHRNG